MFKPYSWTTDTTFCVHPWRAIIEKFSAKPVYRVQQAWTSDPESTACLMATTIWPEMIRNMAQDMAEHNRTSRPLQKPEAHAIIEELRRLEADIQNDRRLKPLRQDENEDIDDINLHLSSYKTELTWQSAPCLFTECYLYRSKTWKELDIFKPQKDATLLKFRNLVEKLISCYINARYERTSYGYPDVSDDNQRRTFAEMTQMSLWGDAIESTERADSPMNNFSEGPDHLFKVPDDRIIIDNDTHAVWEYLATDARSDRRIDIVLGNAGFDLFIDILYALYLLDTRIAASVVFHVKSFPWFVTDCTSADVASMMSYLSSHTLFPDRRDVDSFLERVQQCFDSGTMTVRSHYFWTMCKPFYEMEKNAPALLKTLRSSSLVIFKGDLNYRKLTQDGRWSNSTPFTKAVGSLGPGSGISILALRVVRSDVCVGIDPVKLQALHSQDPGREWVRNGKSAVISFSTGLTALEDRSVLGLL